MVVTKAKESPAVQKARQKLKKRIQQEKKKFSPEVLRKITAALEYELARGSKERIHLKDKEIRLFDENNHPAAIRSRFVLNLLQDIS